MKKLLSLLTLAAILPLGFTKTTIQPVYAANDFSNLPTECEPGAYFVNAWEHTVRSRRISDRATLVVDKSDNGHRGWIAGRTYDVRSFNIKFDVSHLLPGTVINVNLGAPKGHYTIPTMKINMDILKSSKTDNLYFVTCSTTVGGHNVSIPDFAKETWAEDGAFKGITLTAKDDLVEIGLKYVDDTNSTVTVNETPYNVKTQNLFSRCEGEYNHHVGIYMMNNADKDIPYVIEKVGDATDDIYFGETGNYTVAKKTINDLKTVDLANIDNVIKAKQKLDAIPWSKLYSFDQEYMNKDYTAVSKAVNDAFGKLDNTVIVPIFKDKVDALVNANKTLTNDKEITNAENVAAAAEEMKKIVDVDALAGEDKTTYDTALATYNAELAKIKDAAKAILEKAVVAYENGVETITNVEQLENVGVLMSQIPTHYYKKYLTEEETAAYKARITAAETKFNEKTVVNHENWKQGKNAHVVKSENGDLILSSCGESIDNSVEDGNGIFNTEKISVLDFEMALTIHNLPQNVGSWMSFGILEKPEMWLNVDSIDVQNNKGVFYLISRTSESMISIQAYICTLYSNRFFDSKLNQEINVPCKDGEDLAIKMSVETKEIAGVTDEVFTASFNGVTFDQVKVTPKNIKTALETSEGYFMFATSGFSSDNPALVTIKDINGHKALDETLIPEPDLTPTSKDLEKTFVNGSKGGTVVFNIDTKGEDLTSVKVDGQEISKDNYTYDATKGTLTLKNAYLNTLEVKDHTVVAATAEGEVTWTLHVNPNPDAPVVPDTPDNPDTPNENTLNVGALVGGIVGGVIALGAIIFGIIFGIKRKKSAK